MKKYEQAFTLIELLVSMAIVSILTAVAVPQYQQYRARSFDLRALSDLRNVAIAEEAYFMEFEKYLACKDSACTSLAGVVSLSKGTTLEVSIRDDAFAGVAQNALGTGRSFRWDSDLGGILD